MTFKLLQPGQKRLRVSATCTSASYVDVTERSAAQADDAPNGINRVRYDTEPCRPEQGSLWELPQSTVGVTSGDTAAFERRSDGRFARA